MSWWTDVSGATLGDGPADAVRAGLARFDEHRERIDGSPPTLPAFLAALAAALQQTLELPDPPGLVARLDEDRQVVPSDAPPETTLVEALRTALERARLDYRDELDRDPSVADLVATTTFVLAPVAASTLELPEGATRLRGIDAS